MTPHCSSLITIGTVRVDIGFTFEILAGRNFERKSERGSSTRLDALEDGDSAAVPRAGRRRISSEREIVEALALRGKASSLSHAQSG